MVNCMLFNELFFDLVPDYTLENIFSHHLICQGNRNACGIFLLQLKITFSTLICNAILSFILLLVLLAEKCIYFYNLSEISFLFVLLCFMADKLVSTCDTNTTLFSMEANYPNLCLSISSISNASYSKCSKKSYTLSSLFFHLANIQLCCCNLMWKFRLPLTTYA